MRHKLAGQANGLRTEFIPDDALAARCFVAFVKEQIEYLQHAIQTGRKLSSRGNLEGNLLFLEALAGAREPFHDRGLRDPCPSLCSETGANIRRIAYRCS